MELTIRLRQLHEEQWRIRQSTAKRKIIRAGRRWGKTVLAADLAVDGFLQGRRVLYAAPTDDQLETFWFECKRALEEAIAAGIYYKNETKHIIELPDTKQRIRAKTAWNADSLRGDYADFLILDEYQDMKSDAWELVGAPMMLDNDGDAIFIYTKKRGSKGQHASRMFKRAAEDDTGRWASFVSSSLRNPFISEDALRDITHDMTPLAFRMEIGAEEIDEDPDALWTRELIERSRRTSHPDLTRVVVGVDPSGSTGTECGIVVCGAAAIEGQMHYFVIDDRSKAGKPDQWGRAVVTAYRANRADRVLGEVNYGGDMVENTILSVVALDQDKSHVAYSSVRATRGKAVRAEPISALYGGVNPDGSPRPSLVHHVGEFAGLEDEMCGWVPGTGMPSPNRLDALVWCLTELSQVGTLEIF